MKNNNEVMTIAEIEKSLKSGNRGLVTTLKYLRNRGVIPRTTKLNGKKKDLEAIACDILKQLAPIARTEAENRAYQEFVEKVKQTFPRAIASNCDFGNRIFSGELHEREWLVKKDGLQAGIALQLAGDFYVTYAGDAVKMAFALDTPLSVRNGVLTTGFPAHALEKYEIEARLKGILLYPIAP